MSTIPNFSQPIILSEVSTPVAPDSGYLKVYGKAGALCSIANGGSEKTYAASSDLSAYLPLAGGTLVGQLTTPYGDATNPSILLGNTDTGIHGLNGASRRIRFTVGGTLTSEYFSGGHFIDGTLQFGTIGSSANTGLVSLSSSVLEVRQIYANTTAQTLELNNTWTSSTSFEKLRIKANAGSAYQIGSAVGSAGGSNRAVQLGHFNSAGTFTSALSIATSGAITTLALTSTAFECSSVTSSGNINLGGGAQFYWQTRTTMSSPSDGVLLLGDYNVTTFNRIQLGGTTSLFPAIKRSSAAIALRLADDSADAALTCGAITASGDVVMNKTSSQGYIYSYDTSGVHWMRLERDSGKGTLATGSGSLLLYPADGLITTYSGSQCIFRISSAGGNYYTQVTHNSTNGIISTSFGNLNLVPTGGTVAVTGAITASGLLSLQNATTPTEFNLHNTYTSATSREYLKMLAVTGAAYQIGSAVGSAGGTVRDVDFGSWNAAGTFTKAFSASGGYLTCSKGYINSVNVGNNSGYSGNYAVTIGDPAYGIANGVTIGPNADSSAGAGVVIGSHACYQSGGSSNVVIGYLAGHQQGSFSDCFVSSVTDVYFGGRRKMALPATVTIHGTDARETYTTNIGGGGLTLAGGIGTGTGVGGSVKIQVAPAGSSGASLNALVDVITVDSTKLSTFAGPIAASSIIRQSAEITSTPSGTTQTVTLNDGNHQTLTLTSSTGDVTATLTVPTSSSAGTLIINQHGTTPRDITWAVSSGTIKWMGTEPTWASDAINDVRIVSWRYDGSVMYMIATDVGA